MNPFNKKSAAETISKETNRKTKAVSINVKSWPWQKYIYPVAIFIATAAVCLVMYFLYNNVYKTIDQAEVVTNLKGKVVQEQLQQALFLQIIDKIRKKEEGIKADFKSLKNPLNFNSDIKESLTASTTTL